MGRVSEPNTSEQLLADAAATLRPSDWAMFRRLGIPDDLIVRAKVVRVTDAQARTLFGIEASPTEDMSGLFFPYFSPETGWRVTGRLRRDNPEINDEGKPVKKYVAPYGDCRRLFYPPGCMEKHKDLSIPVLVVESEKSVLALTAWAERTMRPLLVVATGGCYGFCRKKPTHNERGVKVNQKTVVWDLAAYLRDRDVYIVPDANIATNPDVKGGEQRLVKELEKRRAKIHRCRLPLIERVNGPDDYIAVAGDVAMAKVLDGASDGVEITPEFSEDALALAFTGRHADDLRYTAGWSQWHQWDGVCWKEDETLHIFDLARVICREQALSCPSSTVAKQITSARTRSAVENLARSDRRHAMMVDDWDRGEWLLNTPGGTIDLRTGTLREPSRMDYITHIASVAPGGACPLWLAFLHRVTDGSEELTAYLQRIAGYCSTGVISEEAFFFLYGSGGNGKGTFTDAVSGILGDYARNASIETFLESRNDRHPTELAYLRGARLVTVTETVDGRRWDESKLKFMTGGDPVTARFMRGDFFQYKPKFKLLISGNHKPGLKSVDEAIRRRLQMGPFTVTIPKAERDKHLKEKLRAEWPGILQWMIEGCLEWQRIGLAPPMVVREATAAYLEAEDAFGRWLDERCEIGDPNAFAGSTALWTSWKIWAEASGEYVGTQKVLSEKLAARPKITGKKTNTINGFLGIRLKNSTPGDLGVEGVEGLPI